MPQDSLFPSDPPDVGLRIAILDHTTELVDALTITTEVRKLDGPWTTFAGLRLVGRGRDFLPSAVEDLVHAWEYEDRRAILREAQRNERLARRYHQKAQRQGV